jgi:hypothetical protein
MTNPNAHRNAKVQAKQMALRNKLWPNLDENTVWNRKKNQGFTTLPRTMPLFMQIMDSLSKGKPVSGVYLDLWCRTFDEGFVTLADKQQTMAFSSGFSGQRAQQTWKNRIEILNKQGFIRLASGPAGPFSHALILNPYHVVKKLRARVKGHVPEDLWNALLARASEIGADDIE